MSWGQLCSEEIPMSSHQCTCKNPHQTSCIDVGDCGEEILFEQQSKSSIDRQPKSYNIQCSREFAVEERKDLVVGVQTIIVVQALQGIIVPDGW